MLTIRHSVGFGGTNDKTDVIVIQGLLNRHMVVGSKHLSVDGWCGVQTRDAIISFQHRAGFRHPDGLIEPNGQTWRALTDPVTLHRVLLDIENILVDAWKWFNHSIARLPENPTHLNFSDWDNILPGFHPAPGQICWGARVSAGFKAKVIDICKDIDIAADYLMACMALETGETFSPSVPNAAGSGAVGLIQFMPLTAENTLGTTTAALRVMTAEGQLDYVKKYMMQYQGKMHSLEDVYMAILYPAYIGQPASTVVFSSGTRAYQQNKGFDKKKDGNITIQEISATVYRQYNLGMKKGNFG